MTRETPSSDKPPKSWTHGGILLLVILGVLFAIDEDEEGNSDWSGLDTANVTSDANQADSTASKPVITPSAQQLTRAANHAGRAMGALGAEGALFYSERCYEAVEKTFSPPSLDRCYAFDMLSERLIEEDAAAYFYPRFWPDNARERWDQAVRKAGLSEADFATRRTALEREIDGASVVLIAPPAPIAYEPVEVQPGVDSAERWPVGEDDQSAALFASEAGLPEASGVSAEAPTGVD